MKVGTFYPLVRIFTLLLGLSIDLRANAEDNALNQAILAAKRTWKGVDRSIVKASGSSSQRYKSYTEIRSVCDGLISGVESSRVACVIPQKPRPVYIYNAKISAHNITIYEGGGDGIITSNRLRYRDLPALESMSGRAVRQHHAPMIRKRKKFDQDECPNGIVDGTLHIITHRTAQNVFHSLNDNILPLFSQIVMDAFLHPRFLDKPRHLIILSALPHLKFGQMQVNLHTKSKYIFRNGINAFRTETVEEVVKDGIPPHLRAFGGGVKVPHFDILNGEFKEGLTNNSECYRRIIWGSGPRLFYHPELHTLRQYAVDLLREYALAKYNPPVPEAYSPAKIVGNQVKDLRASIFLRDPHDGRAMPGEIKIAEFINKNVPGVVAGFCFGRNGANQTLSLLEQISYAAYADIIIGVHGAALTNAVFAPRGVLIMELKSVYGYHVDLFAMIASSRVGGLAHVDVRSYKLSKGGSKPIDESLFDRIGRLLSMWSSLKFGKPAGNSSSLWRKSGIDQLFMIGRFPSMDNGHVLGPRKVDVSKLISQHSAWQYYWKIIGHEYSPTIV